MPVRSQQVWELMRLIDILGEELDELDEAVKRQYKKVGGNIEKRFRCTAGKKKGKFVSSPSICFRRKDPKKVRRGKRLMRVKKKLIQRKSQISKRRSISRLITRMNKRLSGK